jgi:MFS family permease
MESVKASVPVPRAVFSFLVAKIATMVGFQILAVAVGWRMYEITGKALYLGFVGLAQFLPMLALTFPAGHAADRYDRKRVAGICQLLECLAAAALVAADLGGRLDSAGILVAVAVIGAARSFENPAMQSLLPALVPKAEFPRTAALSASATEIASIAGPAIGGVVYALSPAAAIAVASALYLLAPAALSTLRVDARQSSGREPLSFRTFFAGLDFIRRRPAILGAISLDLFAVLLGGATALLPIYAKDILRVGSTGLGALRAAPAIGALAMSLLLAKRPLRRRVGRTMFSAVAVFGLSTIAFALSRNFVLSLAALALLGGSDVVSVVVRQSLVQLWTPDGMRGRVSAVNSLFIGTSNQLGEFESGITAAWLGTVPAALIGGLGTLAVVALWIKLFPSLASVDAMEGAA